MNRFVVLGCLILFTVTAPSAQAATAPGRVAFSIASKVPESNVDAGGAGVAIALPDGGAVMLAYDRPAGGLHAVRLRADGSRDPSFRSDGIASVLTEDAGFGAAQLLRLADGRLLVAVSAPPATKHELPRLVLVRLLAGGAPDPSFGRGGAVLTQIQATCVGCRPMALAPDGSIVVTGNIGSFTPPIATNPLAPTTSEWVVAKFGADGAPDAGFGVAKIPVGIGGGAGGYGVEVTPAGTIVALGRGSQGAYLAGLTALGTPDPAFNLGAPVPVPIGFAFELHRRASGALDVFGDEGLVRFSATGALDTSFATNGKLAVPRGGNLRPDFVPTPDGGSLIVRNPVGEPTVGTPRVTVQRITASGADGATKALRTPFGGGYASSRRSAATTSLAQSNVGGQLIRRDDGSFLLVGGLSVIRYTGEGEGFSAGFVAVQAFTPALEPDLSYGGPQERPQVAVRIVRQRATSSAKLDRIAVRVTASQAGLLLLRVRDARGRVLATITEPIFEAGTTEVRIAVTRTGDRVLRRARRGLRIAVGHDFRDILAGADRGTTNGRMR